jgi:hypothetical protein
MKFELTASGRPGSCSKGFAWALKGLSVATGAVICGALMAPSAVAQESSRTEGVNTSAVSADWHPHFHYRDKREACSDETLKGRYTWNYNGWKADDNGHFRPYASAGYEVYDGEGRARGTSTDSENGKVTTTDFTAAYKIHPDCTGVYMSKSDGNISKFKLYVEKSGKVSHFIQKDRGTAISGDEFRADSGQRYYLH